MMSNIDKILCSYENVFGINVYARNVTNNTKQFIEQDYTEFEELEAEFNMKDGCISE
jgi:multimeric flavodoxin WrbA